MLDVKTTVSFDMRRRIVCWSACPRKARACRRKRSSLHPALSAFHYRIGWVALVVPEVLRAAHRRGGTKLIMVEDHLPANQPPAARAFLPDIQIARPDRHVHKLALLLEPIGAADVGFAGGPASLQLDQDVGHLVRLAAQVPALRADEVDHALAGSLIEI